jgi:hypothetical protein
LRRWAALRMRVSRPLGISTCNRYVLIDSHYPAHKAGSKTPPRPTVAGIEAPPVPA